MPADQAMVCTCCGHWRIIKITIEKIPGHPRTYLRITSFGTLVADVTTVDEVDRVLQSHGIDIANFVQAT